MEELVCREGTVHSVIFQNAENGYTVLRLLTEEGEVVTVVGSSPCAAPGEHLTVTGVWEQHPQHGEQLRAEELERSLPEEEEEIFSYLSSGRLRSSSSARSCSPCWGCCSQTPVTVKCSPGATQGTQPTTVTTSPSSVRRRRTVYPFSAF